MSQTEQPAWPDRLEAEDVGSESLAPFIVPLMVNPRLQADYIAPLKERLLDLTVRMARKHTLYYADALPALPHPLNRDSFVDLPLVTRETASSNRVAFVANITHFAFATFTKGTTAREPLMVERAAEEQIFLNNLLRRASGKIARVGPHPIGLAASNGSHGQVFQVRGDAYGFSVNFSRRAEYPKCAWLLQQSFDWFGYESKISFIQGYFEYIDLLGLYLKQEGIVPPPGMIRSITCYGMAVPNSRRERLSEFFGCPVTDNFSLSEVHGSASWNHKDKTYTYSPFVHAEAVDLVSLQPVMLGTGELVLTTLFPFTQRFPLIRYRTGDCIQIESHSANGPNFRVRGRIRRSATLKNGMFVGDVEIEAALDPISCVSRREGLIDIVREAETASGPDFWLAVEDDRVVCRLHLVDDTTDNRKRVKAAILGALPSGETDYFMRYPDKLDIVFLEA